MQVITEIELLQRIDAFLERHDMAPTTFGRKATGEPQLIDSIRRGRSPSLKVTNKVMDFIAKTDREAEFRLRPPPTQPEESEVELPFAQAPVNPTGASSPISSPTAARPPRSGESGSCRCSTEDQPGATHPKKTSCSVADDASSHQDRALRPGSGQGS